MFRKIIISVVSILLFSSVSFAQIEYPDNENGQFEDMLTPEYYFSDTGAPFRNEINKVVYCARKIEFQHPLENAAGEITPYVITRNFGDGIGGPAGTSQHHAAVDMHLENNASRVTLFAAHSGYISTFTDAPKYRHYLAITKEIVDSTDTVIAKMVTLYAHIDLDLDSTDGLDMNGHYVEKGDTVSMNLYAGTVGGPHLHFEIRFYRPDDVGEETFYSFVGPAGSAIFTDQSAGSWSYGYWEPTVGYGFANPENHTFDSLTQLADDSGQLLAGFSLHQNYPNPFNPVTTIQYTLLENQWILLEVFDVTGVKIQTMEKGFQRRGTHSAHFNGQELPSGVYFYRLRTNTLSLTRKMLLAK